MYKSNAAIFYSYLLTQDNIHLEKTLVGRARSYADEHDVHIMQYVMVDEYRNETIKRLKEPRRPGCDGLIDSVRYLLSHYYVDNARDLLQMLLASF